MPVFNGLPILVSSAPAPSISGSGLFTGATIPLTYYNNTHDYENTYTYKSSGYNITISGLDNATITGNGTHEVTVIFDVTGQSSLLDDFVITLSDGTNTYTFNGLHAHYGYALASGEVLAFAYTNVPPTVGGGLLFLEYNFVVSTTLPCFTSVTTLWESIYSYQLLNVLIGTWEGASIGNNFLSQCYSFNQPLTIPSSVTSIGNSFLSQCRSFNQPLTIPSSVTSIGGIFLQGCYSFNQPLTIPSSVTSIGGSFLQSCYSFNQPLTIPSSVTSIEISFLSQCYSFNQPLTIPSSVTSIGGSFLQSCYAFNQPLTIPSSVTSIEISFLSQCRSFNQPLTIPSSVTSIGGSFLQGCYSFNQPLTIPSSVTSIENSFLSQCHAFNQPLTIPSSVTSIGDSFLSQCYAFNQPLTIPSSVTSIGGSFLHQCYALSTIIYESAVYPTDANSLSQMANSKPNVMGGYGIKVYGTHRADLITALPDSTASPYRKLVDGGF